MKLDYGVPTDKICAEIQFGKAKGFFSDEGIDLTVRVVFGGPEIAAMYDSGELKVGEIGSPPATTAIARGARFKIVGSGVRQRALQYLVVDSTISSWTDLTGKAIGVLSKGSCSYWFSRLLVQNNGLDPDKDVEIVGLGASYANVVDLFKSGELHAAVVSELNVSIGEHRNAFRIMKALTEPEFCPTMQWMVLVANCDFIARQATLLKAVLRACRRTYRYSLANVDEFARFAAEFYNVDVSTILRSIDRERNDLHHDCDIDIEGLDLAIELQRRLGAITSAMSSSDMIDLRFLPSNEAA